MGYSAQANKEEIADKSSEMNGKQSTYKDTTGPRSRYPNTAINVSKAEFEENLLKDKWSKSLSTDGETAIYKKGGAKYVIREEARSTGGTTTDYYKPGNLTITSKIRFDMP